MSHECRGRRMCSWEKRAQDDSSSYPLVNAQERREMRLYGGNIPQLANEKALTNWFARAGMYVAATHLVDEDDSRRCAWVKIPGERMRSKALLHLKDCVSWGRQRVIRRYEPRSRQGLRKWLVSLAILRMSRSVSSQQMSPEDSISAKKTAR